MPYQRGSRGFQPRSQRRSTSWEVGPGGDVLESTSASSSSIIGDGAAVTFDGDTLVRIRGSLQAYLTTGATPGDGFHCGFGIGLITGDAFAASVFPDPLVEAGWDGWIYHRFYDLHVPVTAGIGEVGTAAITFEVDSKAMRKLVATDVIFAALEAVEVGTAVMETYFDSRALLKLP